MRSFITGFPVIILLAACRVGASPAAAPPDAVIISLKAAVATNEPAVHLGSISIFPLPPLLAMVAIAPAPAPGARMRLDRKRIRNAVAMSTRWEGDVKFEGAARVEVERKSTEISAEKLWEAAQAVAACSVADESAEGALFTLVRTGRMLPVLAPDKPYHIEAAAPTDGLHGGKPIFVRLSVRSEEESFPVISRTASFSVRWIARILVARKTIDAGSELTGDLVFLEEREISGRLDDFLLKIPEGCRTGRKIAAGSAIPKRSVEPLPAVKEGERITAFWRSGSIQLSLEAKALEDGWPGSMIKVLDSDRRRILSGLVTRDGNVALVL